MEARLLHARWMLCKRTETFVWQIIHPERRGVPITITKVPDTCDMMNLNSSVLDFLTDLLGEGGQWEGWSVLSYFNKCCIIDTQPGVRTRLAAWNVATASLFIFISFLPGMLPRGLIKWLKHLKWQVQAHMQQSQARDHRLIVQRHIEDGYLLEGGRKWLHRYWCAC